MNQRILKYNLDEIAMNYEEVGKSLNKACHRDNSRYKISGLCQTFNNVIFPAEEYHSDSDYYYILTPFIGMSDDEIISELHTRWTAGIVTKGLIRLSDSFLGLFEVDRSSIPDQNDNTKNN